MSDSAGRARAFVVEVDSDVVVLSWIAGVHLTGSLAADAMAAVDDLNKDGKRPLLVDMTDTGKLTREAREVFRSPCQVSRMALMGRSPVDRVLASFGLQVTIIDTPARFFTSRAAALAWLREGGPTHA